MSSATNFGWRLNGKLEALHVLVPIGRQETTDYLSQSELYPQF